MNSKLLLVLLLAPLAGCGGSRMIAADTAVPKAPLRLIAVVGPTNEFATKFGEELANRGYGIMDSQRTASFLDKLDLNADELGDEHALAELKNRRVDAIMRLTSEMTRERSDLLDKVKIKVNATDGGATIGSIDWTNSWGGMPGSPADSTMRLNIARAATAVATVLVRQLGAPGVKTTALMDDLIAARRARRGAPETAPAPVVPAAPQPKSYSSDVDAPARRGAERPDDFAFLVGIEEYQTLPKADFGARDAQTVRRHYEAMGVPARNIISLEGSQATGGKMKSYLQQWLPRNVKPSSTLFVYYSGHGAPDPASGEAYLVPWDTDPMFLETTAYPLKQFYAELAALKAKRVIVALDACFSGSGGRSVLAKGARPLVAKVDESVPEAANLSVLAAASGTEITGSLDEQGHGIFTYHYLKALAGGAKTPRALYDALKPRVQDDARRQNREQSPTLNGGGTDSAF